MLSKMLSGVCFSATALLNIISLPHLQPLLHAPLRVDFPYPPFQVNLNVSGPGLVHPPLSGEVFKAADANITHWVKAEKVKAATAKAKNDLETYIINTREKLETNEQYQEVGCTC